jgi:superfamily II DNA or RNA helicase
MKTLFPKQQESVDRLLQALKQHGCALDSSMTGVGKTIIASRVALQSGRPVLVLCPKIVIPHWERELAEVAVKPLGVLNYEKLRRGNTPWLNKIGKKLYRWCLPEGTLLVFDECHYCKGAFTQNTQMLIAAKQQGFGVLMLSATACKDPTEMRGMGYVLGLHALNKPVDGLQSWFGWMLKLGCKKDPWNNWKAGPRERLTEVRDCIYPHKGVQLTPNDLPRAFAENHVMTEPLAFSALKDIASFYEQHGITPEIVDRFLEGGIDAPNVLVEMLRARQLAEAAKVPDILDMVRDARDEGYSVVVFVNFSETLNTLCDMLGSDTARVCGGQSGNEREQNVQRFQRNECGVIVCNTAAGGVGVSLHDEHGGHPRMALLSPTFNEKEYVQVLGRIHRAGSKSPALQRVLIASGTIEEKIIAKLEEKRKDMAALHEQLKTES